MLTVEVEEFSETANVNLLKQSWWARIAVGGTLFDAFLMEGECRFGTTGRD